MRNPFIIGEKIYLRPLEKSDLSGSYLSWVNDPEVTRYMETGTFPTNLEKLEEYYSFMTTSPNYVILAIIDKELDKGKHIGNITLNNINWIHRIVNLGFMIGDKDYWGKGYGTEAIELMVKYAFATLNLHKISVGIYADHIGSIRAFKKAGFIQEAKLEGELYRDGKYRDKIIMRAMTYE